MRTGFLILAISILLSVVLAIVTHGHVLFFGLPLVIGLPLAGIFGRRR
jgi:hypothetical protein